MPRRAIHPTDPKRLRTSSALTSIPRTTSTSALSEWLPCCSLAVQIPNLLFTEDAPNFGESGGAFAGYDQMAVNPTSVVPTPSCLGPIRNARIRAPARQSARRQLSVTRKHLHRGQPSRASRGTRDQLARVLADFLQALRSMLEPAPSRSRLSKRTRPGGSCARRSLSESRKIGTLGDPNRAQQAPAIGRI
jgi:hypothetical protein